MRKILYTSLIAALLLTACAAPQGKTTVSQDVTTRPEPTEFVLNTQPIPEKKVEVKKEKPTVKVLSVEEDKESSVSLLLAAHMIENNLPDKTANKYANYIMQASEEHGVDPYLIMSIIHVETGGTFRFKDRPNSHGAIGLMQILKSNAKWMGVSAQGLYDPKTNIKLGTKYLKYLQDRFGHDLGITAYNQGEGNVARGTYRTWYFNKVNKVFKSIKRS